MTVTILCILAMLEQCTNQSAPRTVMICFIIKNFTFTHSNTHINLLVWLGDEIQGFHDIFKQRVWNEPII